MTRWFRTAALGAVAVSMSACALPPAIEVASLVLGGVSFVATGKGVSDHALSVVVGEDCALYRPVVGKEICIPEDETEDWTVALAEGRLKGIEELEEMAASVEPGPGPALADRDPWSFAAAPTLPDGGTAAQPDLDAVAAQLAAIDTAAGGETVAWSDRWEFTGRIGALDDATQLAQSPDPGTVPYTLLIE